MPIAAGIFKQLAYKYEATYGTAPGQASGQQLRRVTSTLDLTKDTYQSNEIVGHQQLSVFRHGVRRVGGSINGELSPLTWKDFFAMIMKRDFAAVTAITAASITISGTGPTYTVARAAGSFLTDGIKAGQVVRLSAGTFNAANLLKNMFVVSVIAASIVVIPLNGVAMVAEGPIASSTVTVIGKTNFIPTSGHTDKSMSIEHWHSDPGFAQSELFLGIKAAACAIDLPPTGIATINWDLRGQDMADTAAKRTAVATTAQYFTTPTAATTSDSLAAVNGVVRLAGSTIATLTGLSLNIAANFTGDPVVGSNIIPNQFPGRVLVTGQASMYFDGVAARDAFINETESEILAAFTTNNTGTADFLAFSLPRVKFGGASKDDGEKGIVQTLPFTALYNSAGGAGTSSEQSTFAMQDSLA